MLNWVKHEILNAHTYKNIKKSGLFSAQIRSVVGRKKIMLSSVEHEKSFITSGLGLTYHTVPRPIRPDN